MQTTEQSNVQDWLGSGSINVFGLPMAGKDTQCRRLAKVLDGVVLGGGDILRKREDLPATIKAIMERGELIPVEDYLRIVTPYLAQDEFANHPLILSSVGRFKGEESGVLQACMDAGHPLRVSVVLELDERLIFERWKAAQDLLDRGQRADDARSALDLRLDEFHRKTRPVLDFYQQQGLLVRVDGDGTVEEVESRIWRAVSDYAGGSSGPSA